MRSVIACVGAVLALGHASATAQPTGSSIDRLRTCATLPIAERTKCLDQLSRTPVPGPASSRSAAGIEDLKVPENWIFSETTSPLDYSPVIVATVTAGAPAGSAMKLSISCRAGATSFALGGAASRPAGERFVVWYTIDGTTPKQVPAITTSGTGVALGGDVVGFLFSLPPRGEITFRLVDRHDMALEGRYSLVGLKTTRERMATPCKWPARPNSSRS